MEKRKLALIIAGCGVLVLVGTLSGMAVYAAHYLPSGTKVGGVLVGGMNRQQLAVAVTSRQQKFLTTELAAEASGQAYSFKPEVSGISFDNSLAFQQAFHDDLHSPINRIYKSMLAFLHPADIPVILTSISSSGEATLKNTVWPHLEQTPTEPFLTFSTNSVVLVDGVVGTTVLYDRLSSALASAYATHAVRVTVPIDTHPPIHTSDEIRPLQQVATQLLAQPLNVHIGTTSQSLTADALAKMLTVEYLPHTSDLTFKTDSLSAFVTQLQSSITQAPQNARLGVTDGRVSVIAPSKDGLKLDLDASAAALRTYVAAYPTTQSAFVVLPTAIAPASVREDSLAALGIHDLIGTATTDFSGSPTNRVFNITLGTKTLDSKIVADGASFSTIGSLAPIDEVHGYKDELVILGNRTVPEAGGGLCQVSTTLFRSVLNAGLPVLERTNHAYRVGYYEVGVGPGLDATVYDPSPDFVWKNDTGHSVYIQSQVVGNKLTFDLYGTKDGRSVVLSVPQILEETPPGDPIYTQTDTLPKGTTKQIEHPHPGAKTIVTYTVSRNGQSINNQTFRSTYRPWPAQFLVGTH